MRGRPDPMRSHGAWVFLFLSVAAGAILGARRGVEPALLVGTGFAGGYLVVAALDVGLRRKARQLAVGLALAALALLAALQLGAEQGFLAVAAGALVLAIAAVVLTRQVGLLSRLTLTTSLAAVALAAPAAAVAGGASTARAGLLFALLWPFFCWRSLRVAAPLRGGGDWNRVELRAQGLREAGYAAVWALCVSAALRLA